jgi:acetyltransferase
MGGTGIEITRDFSLRMLPLREADAEAMIAETRGAAMLHEHRGGAAADVKGLIACLEGLADFAWQNAELIEEVDLNPIKALPHGCIIVDALIVTSQRG